MERIQAFRFELRPDAVQLRQLKRFTGAARFVFNKALALQIENHRLAQPFIHYVAMAKLLTAWRNSEETPWLKDPPTHALQHTLKDLEKSYQNFFDKRADFPRFKKKNDGRAHGLRFPDRKQIKLDQANSRVSLPKLGWIRYRNSREVLGDVRNVTVSQDGEKWMISIQTRREVVAPAPTEARADAAMVGLDLGVVRFATLSTGEVIAPLHSFRVHRQQLAKAQRKLSHKQKYSQNWRKAKEKVARVHRKIRNARRDFLHKASTHVSKNHATVCIEDLQIANMSKSSKGDQQNPGINVAQKSGLNRAILDQGWGEFRRQLAYKLAWRGGALIAVAPQYTSQTCPMCAHVSADNRRTQASFVCVSCTFEQHADLVAAINIRERGHRLLAWEFEGGSLKHPRGENGARKPLVEAGTRRSKTRARENAVGIPVL